MSVLKSCPDLSSGATTDDPGLNGTELGVAKTNSYLCPQRYFCQSGDPKLYPCPNGTYNDQLGAAHIGQCKPCAKDHYNPWVAQNSCLSCSPLSSKPAADRCECTGNNQVYQVCRNRTIQLLLITKTRKKK